jgi:hypothetical protein
LVKIVVKHIEKTCNACPSQWEGRAVDNRPIYIRYRWGWLSVHLGRIGHSINDAVRSRPWYDTRLGDSLDGFLDEADLEAELRGLMAFS